MRKETVKIYTFDELTKEAQEIAAQQHYNFELYDGSRNQFFMEDIQQQLAELFPNSSLKIQYSLSYSQGDGLNIYGALELEDIMQYIFTNYTSKQAARLAHYIDYAMSSIKLPYNDGHYAYCVVNQTEITDDVVWALRDYRNLDIELLKDFESRVRDFISELCEKFEVQGYDTIYAEITIEDMQEIANGNGYEFYEDGSFY